MLVSAVKARADLLETRMEGDRRSSRGAVAKDVPALPELIAAFLGVFDGAGSGARAYDGSASLSTLLPSR
jgi:hypothetical protein